MAEQNSIKSQVMFYWWELIPTLGLTLVAGPEFPPTADGGIRCEVILNETAMRMLGWDDPRDAIGQIVLSRNDPRTVVGVVQGGHLAPLGADHLEAPRLDDRWIARRGPVSGQRHPGQPSQYEQVAV